MACGGALLGLRSPVKYGNEFGLTIYRHLIGITSIIFLASFLSNTSYVLCSLQSNLCLVSYSRCWRKFLWKGIMAALLDGTDDQYTMWVCLQETHYHV